MIETTQKTEPASATLCKSCGLCCTGHLFAAAQLDSSELETTLALGLNVLQSNPDKPVFSLPCPLWRGQCTIYPHPHKPSICADFKCKLLKEVEQGETTLDGALAFVQKAKELIQELEGGLPCGQKGSFRGRLSECVKQLEEAVPPTEAGNAFRLRAGVLLILFAQHFGVTGLFNAPEQEALGKGNMD